MLVLYSNQSPNSQKIAIFLAETEIPYDVVKIDLFKGEHLTREFHKLNPNNKLPVLTDTEPGDGGGPLTVFESGAILVYLAEKYGRFLASDVRNRAATIQWLCWQISGQGPMVGQAHHFIRYAPANQEYAVNRYFREATRLLNVMESRLREAEFLAGDEYSIADMACFPFANMLDPIGIDVAKYPAVERWLSALLNRTAIKKVLSSDNAIPSEYVKQRMELTDEQWSVMFGDRMHEAASPK